MKNQESLNILIVEDDRVSSAVLKSQLLKSGLNFSRIDAAETFAQTLDCIRQYDYSVILLDLNLPDSRGIETLDKLVREFPRKPIVVITGDQDENLGLRAISDGAQEYLVKGKYGIENLVQAIRYSISRKKAEERAREDHQLLEILLSQLPHKILLKHNDSVFRYCNPHFAKSLGLSPDQICGKTDYDFYTHEKAEQYIASDKEVIASGGTVECFFEYQEDGQKKISRLLKTAVKNEFGQPDGVLCLFEDFTERIQSERQLKAMNIELEKANRQLKETHLHLVQNEKLASIGQLAAGIAHEINNPMAFVISNFNSLKEYIESLIEILSMYDEFASELKEKQDMPSAITKITELRTLKEKLNIKYIIDDMKELFADSQEGMNRVIHIVKSLRDFSRVDQAGDKCDYNLNEGIRSTLVVARNELKYIAEIKTEYNEIPEILCNPGQVNQVFLNILINAAQAIESQQSKEAGTISIRTYSEKEYVVCEIEDNGPGIPKENLSKIFDPFFTTKPPGKGTGLGLNVSYDIIINKHQGLLMVDSELGKRTTFIIKLPTKTESDNKTGKEPAHGTQNCTVCG